MRLWGMRKVLGRLLLLAALAAFSIPARVYAQDAVTLQDAYRMALENNEAIKIAGEGVSQAKTNLDKATSRILPNLTAEGGYTKYSEAKTSGALAVQPDESSRADLKVTQPLYTGGREWATRRQAKILIEKSREGLEGAKENIIKATAGAYFGVLKAGKDVEIKRAALKRAVERKNVAQARFKVGELTRSAVLRAEADEAGAEAELTRSESGLIDAKNRLKRVLGADREISVIEPEPQSPMTEGVESLVLKALASRSDYRQSESDEKAASEGITFARGGFLPSLRIEGLYSHKDQSPKTTFFVENSTSATVVLTYPLFEGGLRKAELSEARSKLRESELRRLGLKRDIEVDVRDSFNNVQSARAVIDSYRKQASFAEENYKMVFEQFKFGLATTVDVTDADATLISAQRSYANSLYDLELAVLDLKYSTGTLFEETIGERK
ncbi:MAG: TolC family protein [Deltaproteobacteria bacterium]|nr:TolC family protein [Deltaproteobacteria bacterium]